MEDDTNSRASGQEAVPCYVRPRYTGASLADQEPARKDGSLGSLWGLERPPLTPLRWCSPDPDGHSNPSQANLR